MSTNVNQTDYNAALATIDYLKETVEAYKQQLIRRDAYLTVKVEGNYWVYGSDKACAALQRILFEHLELTKRDVQTNVPSKPTT